MSRESLLSPKGQYGTQKTKDQPSANNFVSALKSKYGSPSLLDKRLEEIRNELRSSSPHNRSTVQYGLPSQRPLLRTSQSQQLSISADSGKIKELRDYLRKSRVGGTATENIVIAEEQEGLQQQYNYYSSASGSELRLLQERVQKLEEGHRNEILELKALHAQEGLREECEKLRNTVRELQFENEEQKERLAEKTHTIANLQLATQQNKDLLEEVEHLRRALRQARDQSTLEFETMEANYQAQLESLRTECDKLQRFYDETRDTLNQRNREKVAEQERLRESNFHSMKRIQELVEENQLLKRKNERLKNNVLEIQLQFARLQEQTQENQQRVMQRLHEIEGAEDQVSTSQTARKLIEENLQLKQQLAQFEAYVQRDMLRQSVLAEQQLQIPSTDLNKEAQNNIPDNSNDQQQKSSQPADASQNAK